MEGNNLFPWNHAFAHFYFREIKGILKNPDFCIHFLNLAVFGSDVADIKIKVNPSEYRSLLCKFNPENFFHHELRNAENDKCNRVKKIIYNENGKSQRIQYGIRVQSEDGFWNKLRRNENN